MPSVATAETPAGLCPEGFNCDEAPLFKEISHTTIASASLGQVSWHQHAGIARFFRRSGGFWGDSLLVIVLTEEMRLCSLPPMGSMVEKVENG